MPAPTIQVFSDTFTTRAVTPTGSTTGSYGPPNSSWGVGNGWYDLVGSPGTTPGSGYNITSAGASMNIVGKFGFLMQDPAVTPTPNHRIVVTFPSISTSNASTYYALVRGTYNTDAYGLVMNNSQVNLTRLSAGNGTTNTIGTPFTYAPVAGHTYSLDLTCTGDGASTTSLTGVVKDVTAGTTICTVNGTDTTLELQSGGRVGFGSYQNAAGTMSATSAVIYSDQALSYTQTYIAFLGDSLSYGLSTTLQTAPDLFCRLLNSFTLNKRYVPINMGFSGAKTSDWQNGAASGYLAAAVQNINALGCKNIMLTLGSNDAIQGVTAATWLSNMQAIITYLKANVPGCNIIVNQPPFLDWVRFSNAFGAGATAATLPLLRTYAFSQLTGCYLGDSLANSTFQYLNYQGLTDGGHPSDQGVPELTFLWLMAYMKYTGYIGPASLGTVSFSG